MSEHLIDVIVACGGLDATLDRVHEYLDAGADHVCIHVLTPGNEVEPTVELWWLLAEAFEF